MEVKIKFAKHDFLIHTWWQIEILNIVIFVRRIEHCGNILLVLLLSNTQRYSDIAHNIRIKFESNLESAIVANICLNRIRVNIAMKFKSF